MTSAEAAQWVGAIAGAIGAIAAAFAVKVASNQLGNMNATLRTNTLLIVLQLEAEMNSRKQKVDEALMELEFEKNKSPQDQDRIRAFQRACNGYLENWFNSVERLCYCIRKGYLHERDWHSEYRGYLDELFHSHPEKFDPNSPYTNMIDLYNDWKRK